MNTPETQSTVSSMRLLGMCCFNCCHWVGKRRKDRAYCNRLHLSGRDAPTGGDICVLWEKRANAFIARARTMSPLACKMALAGIEWSKQLSALAFVYGIPSTETQVQRIIDIWEGGQP